jgi:hypothetical protein
MEYRHRRDHRSSRTITSRRSLASWASLQPRCIAGSFRFFTFTVLSPFTCRLHGQSHVSCCPANTQRCHDVMSRQMFPLVEDLAAGWRRLDARIDASMACPARSKCSKRHLFAAACRRSHARSVNGETRTELASQAYGADRGSSRLPAQISHQCAGRGSLETWLPTFK